MSNYTKEIAPHKIQNTFQYHNSSINSEKGHNYRFSYFFTPKKPFYNDIISALPKKEIFPHDENEYIYLDDLKICKLPSKFKELKKSINKSKYILKLEDNWDDEGSVKYEKNTWVGAIKFICNYATFIYEYSGNVMPAPNIYHAPSGSIDMEWQIDNFYLLINIDKYGKEVSFYNKNEAQESEGKFTLKDYNPKSIPLFSIFITYFLNVWKRRNSG